MVELEDWEIILKGNRKLRELLQKEAEKRGLSYTEVSTLYFLKGGEKNVSGLAEFVGVNKSTMVEILDKLENEGMITRSRNDKDRRVVLVKITQKGLEELEDVRQGYKNLIKEILAKSEGDVIKFFQIIIEEVSAKENVNVQK
ncbi:MarR family transcriptional regulator [Acidianus sp. HS-5]|uniref:MarR family winged helix-turn-helix transcriptional regulator n=1 Tax=Acidianus sp. HS-5 TaxID=2886040 RepID=UPI001F032345|nr:MarR family transcriptional regulator [Acidianus sp. HS-5]BDC19542.1 transcriptional regulator [Acidianus sp. HS-5]